MRRMAKATGARLPGPPAAAKLAQRKTFLVDHTESHSHTQSSGGSTWSVKIHDFGKQWIESSWGKVDAKPGKRGFKGKSANKEQNEKRARARATGEMRRKCLSIGADHLVTLTYRDNVEDREGVLDRSGALTAHALAWWPLYALCGGIGMSEARGDPSASSCPWLSKIFVFCAAVGTRSSAKHRVK